MQWIRRSCLIPALLAGAGTMVAQSASSMPHLERQGDRHALIVDGKPFLLLGAQINNSSAWPATLPEVWPALADLHANTMEAPVYWEQMEPKEHQFDFSNVDALVQGARQHGLRMVLLWFGTWKNGQNHYVPEWVKTDTIRFPREISAEGKVLDVMSPHAEQNLDADKAAFAALMHHVREIDGEQHTVIMIQVENESGAIGTVRDHSPATDRAFAGEIPPALAKSLGVAGKSWREAYGPDAEERFAAYSTAHYIGEVAKAGKAEYALPMYCNIWITYPVHALANRDRPSPGQEYPAGGPQQGNVAIWKAAAPAIDVLAPDFYSDDFALFQEVVKVYARPDNPLFIPETGISTHVGRELFYALGKGAIGFSPFGIDYTEWTLKRRTMPANFGEDYEYLAPMADVVADLNFKGALQTIVETPGDVRKSVRFGDVQATASFGFPQRDGEMPPGTSNAHGRALIGQIGPDDFLVTGVDVSVSFALAAEPGASQNSQLEILQAEQGHYVSGAWQRERIWNGDQTDRGLQFFAGTPQVVHIRLHRLPAYADRK